MRTGVTCNENRFSPVRISTQGKPVLVLYGIAVYCGFQPVSTFEFSIELSKQEQTLLNFLFSCLCVPSNASAVCTHKAIDFSNWTVLAPLILLVDSTY